MPQRVIFSKERNAAERQNLRPDDLRRSESNDRRSGMNARKKTREVQRDMVESAHKIWLAGLGAMAVAEEEGSKLFKTLVDRGHDIEDRGKEQVERAKGTLSGVRTVAESYWETFERKMDEQLTAVIHRVGVPTKDEIETLTKKVEDLTKSVEKLRAKDAVKPRTRTAKASPSKAKTSRTTKK
jgi:poly(hydroxyalkanoate) granule-associated protein